MALTGRPPKPGKVRELEGNPGRRPIKKEPEPTEAAALRPDHLEGDAAEEWTRAVAAMPPGFYTSADTPVLTVYALAWVRYREALELIAQEGMVTRGGQGQLVPHPAVGIASKNADIILRASDRLGMSPAARARVAVKEEPPPSKFAGLIGGGPGPELHLVR